MFDTTAAAPADEESASRSTFVDTRLVTFDLAASTWQDVVRQLAANAQDFGYVTDGYADDVIAREELYPTGLPCDGLGVAVPHAMTQEHVLAPTIAYARLKEPVAFKEMGDGEHDVNVEAVFLLVAKGEKGTLQVLQDLVLMLSDADSRNRLKAASTPEQLVGVLDERLS